MAQDMGRNELKEKIERGGDFVLVDALSQQHYERSHLPGAVNLPYEFVDDAEQVLPDKNAEIVVYCMNVNCAASGEEVRELEALGYKNVRHYAEGKQDWLEAGLPVESKRKSRLGGI